MKNPSQSLISRLAFRLICFFPLQPTIIRSAMKQTRLLSVNLQDIDAEILAQATAVFHAGGLVSFPTETVYGLGADALNETAVRKIFTAKQRPAYDPIIAHIATVDDLPRLAINIPDVAYQLADHFWPGPLTLILPKAAHVPDALTAGGATVAVRCPNHPLAQALIRAAGTPIGAPSANRFSHTSPTTAQHVWDDLNGRIDLILDGGATTIGVESTVLDLTQAVPVLLRPGGVTLEALTAVLPIVRQRETAVAISPDTTAQPSPGMLDKHYAPKTPLWLFSGSDAHIRNELHRILNEQPPKQTALMIAEEDLPYFTDHTGEIGIVGSLADLDGVAKNLFRTMRQLDNDKNTLILARNYPAVGIGQALQDRLRRAAASLFTN